MAGPSETPLLGYRRRTVHETQRWRRLEDRGPSQHLWKLLSVFRGTQFHKSGSAAWPRWTFAFSFIVVFLLLLIWSNIPLMVSRSSFQQALGSHWFDLHSSLQKITMKIVFGGCAFCYKVFFSGWNVNKNKELPVRKIRIDYKLYTVSTCTFIFY